jgi:adenylate cyclase
VAQARILARLRDRGHRLAQIREAGEQGRLAYGYIEEMFAGHEQRHTLRDASRETGLEPELIERFWVTLGLPAGALDELTDDDLQALRYVASVVEAGFPLVAFLQLARVYGQALAQMADAEVRLFHLYVHEPLMRDGVPGLQMAEEMENLAGDLLPLASPIMDYVHQRFLQHFIEQDMVGHMEVELGDGAEPDELGRVHVAIAFADLAGYTRYTEEEGEEEALSFVERFIDAVGDTLPEGARVVKTIGDEVMVVGGDPAALCEWAVGFQALFQERPAPRIGIHRGYAIYRDGDYFGRDVNLAARVVARARGSEVLITDAVREAVEGLRHLEFEDIGQVKLKGFNEPHLLSRAMQAEVDE